MDSTMQLFIRAAKSKNPNKRIFSVYRRYYLFMGNEVEQRTALCGIFTGIVDKYCPMTSCELINAMSPRNHWSHSLSSYTDTALSVLISRVRFARADAFADLTPPLRFKNRHNQGIKHEAIT